MSNYVTRSECREMRQAHADGMCLMDIGKEWGYATDTIRTHVKNEACEHAAEQTYELERECPFCGEPVAKYPGHIPTDCEGLA